MFNRPINRWWTVLAGFLGNGVGTGVVAATVLGVFVKEISREFDWDRSYATAGISCLYVVSGLGSIALGSLMTRYSIRAITILFVALFALSIMAVGAVPNSLIVFCLIFSAIGFFGSAATAMPYAVAISRQFDGNRGMALAIMISGAGFGSLLLPSFATWLMETQGWRMGYFGIGLLVGIVSLVGLIFFFRTPPIEVSRATDEPSQSLKDIFTTSKTFWIIAGAILCISIALLGLITNFVPILTDRGITPARAATIVGLLGASSWVSRLAVGLVLDRIHAKYVAAGIFLLAASAIVTTAFAGDGPAVYLAAILLGLGVGAEGDLITFTVSRFFAPQNLSRALGAVWIFWAWGNGLGVFFASLSFDLTGSYGTAFALFAALALIGCFVILRLGEYRYPVNKH